MLPRIALRSCLATLALPLALIAISGCGTTARSGSGASKGSHPPALASIALSPTTANIAPGATQQFKATGTWSDGSTGDVTTTANWTSSSTSVATVQTGVATAVAAGSSTITATISGVSGTANLTVTPAAPTLSSIAIMPASISLVAGATQQFTATGTYSDGSTQNLTSSVTWTSSSTAIASINAAGLGTAASAGSATITAADAGVSSTANLTVTAPVGPTLTSIAVAPPSTSIMSGATQQYTATGTYSDGSTQNLTSSVTWTSSSTAVASINAAGLATAASAGSTTITAMDAGVSGTANLTVTAPVAPTLTSIAVTPPAPSISAGATQQFTATGTYSDGSTQNLTSTATWASSNNSVATINAAGLATGVSAGSATVTATLTGVSGTAALTVTAPAKTITSITVAPSGAIIPTRGLLNFHATAAYSDGSSADITSTATWSSSSTAAATIAPGGFAYGVSPGTTTISASLNGVTGSVNASVKTVSNLTIAPTSATIAAKATQQFTAEATYTDSTQQDVTTFVPWTSSNPNYATINSSGLATGVLPGTTNIGANWGGYAANAILTVTNATGQGFDIPTWHVDNDRSGLNSQETTLTPANVNSSSFGKLFSIPVDGYVYASPLLLSNLTINGALHNVLFVATEYDSVYAFDADTGAQLWHVSLLQSGETPLSGAPIKPWLGVTSTPVIDRSTGTLYVVSAQTSPASGGTFRLSALDITTGATKLGPPATINVSVPATNSDSVNGVQTLTTSCIQRAALLEANGNIYIGFGSCHSGWLVAYNALSLKLAGVFNASTRLDGEGPYASAGGVWMGGGGPVADSSGNVYITTGNGPWNGTDAWGDSVLKFPPSPTSGPNGTMQPSDYFTPSIYQYMDCDDADLASGGLMMIPGTSTLIAGGKTGTMFLVDSNSLGHESANDAGVIQEQVWGDGLPSGNTYPSTCTDSTGTNNAKATSYEIFGTSAYFNNYVYLGVTPTSSTAPGGVRQFEYSGTLLPFADTTPSINQGTRGTSPFISANGTSNGIVWMIDEGYPIQNTQSDPNNPGTTEPPTSATLRAFDAASYPNELYDSSQNAADVPGYGIKFTSPIVANGKVYISTGHDLPSTAHPQGEIDVYGLK